MIDSTILFRLITHKVSLDEAFVLWNKFYIKPYLNFYRVNSSVWDTLIAERYLNASKELTTKGIELCVELFPEVKDDIPTPEPTNNFEEFWANFPATDKHGNFKATRYIRNAKNKTKLLYNKLVDSGVDPADLLKAIKIEVEFRKSNSVKENQLRYLSSPYTWLYNANYSIILESSSENNISDETFYGKDFE